MKEELREAMDSSIQKMLGVAELIYSAGKELKTYKEEALEGISLLLWNAAHELNDAYSLYAQEAEGEKGQSQ